jgi:hypothetical protein
VSEDSVGRDRRAPTWHRRDLQGLERGTLDEASTTGRAQRRRAILIPDVGSTIPPTGLRSALAHSPSPFQSEGGRAGAASHRYPPSA